MGPSYSEDAAHQSAIDTDRGAINGGSALTTDEGDGVADLPWIDQPAKQRGGAVLGDEALFGIIERQAGKNVLQECLDALGARGARSTVFTVTRVFLVSSASEREMLNCIVLVAL